MKRDPRLETRSERETLRTLRRFLLGLVLFGAIGYAAELFLLEHTESLSQLIPFAALAAAILCTIAVAFHPTRVTVRLFQSVMGLIMIAGILGLYLHYDGNAAFELEMDASASGPGLVWRSLRGATPALAPGGLVLLGLLGLMFAYRHPALDAGNLNEKQEDV